MNRVTYIIGAGASAQCVSIGNRIADGFKSLKQVLTEYGQGAPFDRDACTEIIKGIEEILAHIDPTRDRAIPFGSIDEYAKFLYEGIDSRTTAYKTYRTLKVLLSLLIKYEEKTKTPDQRYTRFFSHVFNNGALDNNVRVISWNYDSQFELSYSALRHINIQESRKRLGMRSKNLFQLPESHHGTVWLPPLNQFSILKLNGSADFYHTKIRTIFGDLDELLHDICDKYRGSMQGKFVDTLLSFAWEDEDRVNGYDGVLTEALRLVKDTDILVIIGYAIQSFNVEVDRAIFQGMRGIQKVVIQDLSPELVESKYLNLIPLPMRISNGKRLPIEHFPIGRGFPLPSDLSV